MLVQGPSEKEIIYQKLVGATLPRGYEDISEKIAIQIVKIQIEISFLDEIRPSEEEIISWVSVVIGVCYMVMQYDQGW